ncbi:hypothetical protein JZU46_03750 [bacterium]|jgi:hypothetical protein|nr:hypothetical protein [bacterium]
MTENIIVVNTCDAYEDVWELFFCALHEHWPECKYKIIVNTETKQKTIGNINVQIHNFYSPTGVDQWGLRLKQTLIACDSKYVLMLYDDFVLEGPVEQIKIDNCTKWLDNNSDIAVFYFNNNPVNENTYDGRFENFELIPKKGDYKLNSAPALWRREKLLEFIEDSDNPWAWELFGSYRTYKSDDLFYCVKKDHEDIYPYNYAMGGAIYRGKWVGKVVLPLISKYNLAIDIDKRGLADGAQQENRRSFLWKMQFILLGYRMIGFGVFLYIYRILRKKFGI